MADGRRRAKSKSAPASSSVPYHRNFRPPTAADRSSAIGPFPSPNHASKGRRSMLLKNFESDNCERPSLNNLSVSNFDDALADVDDRSLYIPKGKSETRCVIPKPSDALDWLAQVPEEGQNYEEYISFLTLRSGRIRSHANAGGETIVLLPLVRDTGTSDNKTPTGWPTCGPPLDPLVEYTRAFFDRRVVLLPPATIQLNNSSHKACARGDPGAFAKSTKATKFGLKIQTKGPTVKIIGRRDKKTQRVQFQVESILEELAAFREGRLGAESLHQTSGNNDNEEQTQEQASGLSAEESAAKAIDGNFCIMGITMEDLYDGPKDLFNAGMAFGGSKVAVFSFCRYHPHLKMSPLHWFKHGYGVTADSYSYFDDGCGASDEATANLRHEPPNFGEMTGAAQTDFLRRCTKLVVHELGHIYGLDHCIFNRCVMMGTGHLVEDFAAPSHLCGVCLRKLQWRLGFRVRERYRLVAEAFAKMGMKTDAAWAKRQAAEPSKTVSRGRKRKAT